jgi:uncharacterized protein (DUF2236 family)
VAALPLDVDTRVEQVRTAIADALRNAVAGNNADDRRAQIMSAPGERWFADDSPVRTVHSDSSMFIGGLRALLLQTLHPLAMAGVAQHSDYRNDPWGRLQRTADYIAVTTFGPADLAEQTVARVRAVHAHVKGVSSEGVPYSATDPHLLRWVHIAEIDSFLTAYQTYGAGRLTPQQADRYVEEMALVARKIGVPAPPLSVRGLRDQLSMYCHETRATPEAHDAVRFLLVQPPVQTAARVPYALIASAAVATLPVWARGMLRLPWVPLVDGAVTKPIGRAVAGTLRWAAGAFTDAPTPTS